MTLAQRSKGESRQKTSEYLKEDVCPMLLHWANVRRSSEPSVSPPPEAGKPLPNGCRGSSPCYSAPTGIDIVDSERGSDCSAKQTTPPGPTCALSFSSARKCRMSAGLGEAVRLNSSG